MRRCVISSTWLTYHRINRRLKVFENPGLNESMLWSRKHLHGQLAQMHFDFPDVPVTQEKEGQENVELLLPHAEEEDLTTL